MTQQPTTLIVGIGHFPELRPYDPRNTVVSGQSLVNKSVICREQLKYRAILFNEV